MFVHDGVLNHPLSPSAYSDGAVFDAEMQRLFKPAWGFACLASDLARPGDQLARDLHGVPVVLRNDGGELRGFVNVCAHRHGLIAPAGCSHAKHLTCMVHGWEYDKEGSLCRLPDGTSFKGFDAKNVALKKIQIQVLGPFVLAHLDVKAPSLLAPLGEFGDEVRAFFGDHRVVRLWSTEHDVNWKIIAENAVESYHVPLVHPRTFRAFRPPELHDHTLGAHHTRYLDLKPWENDATGLAARFLAKLMLPAPTMRRFTQAHVFPGTLLYHGDLVSTWIALEPLAPTRTRHVAISVVPEHIRGGAWMRPLQWLFGRTFAALGERILREDMALWPSLQHGLSHSDHTGVLSCREERVHAFQRHVADHLAEPLVQVGRKTSTVQPR